MKTKIRVTGKDQNRTALGIINAYLMLYPDATLSDLRKAFPSSLNPDGGIKEIFVPLDEAKKRPDGFFLKQDEVITLKNRQRIAIKYLWTENSYRAIEKQAMQFGIEAKKIAETDPFEKGSYKIERVEEPVRTRPVEEDEIIIIEETIPAIEEIEIIEVDLPKENRKQIHINDDEKIIKQSLPKKKESLGWLWWLLAIFSLALLLFFGWKKCKEKELTEEPFIETTTEIFTVKEPYSFALQ